MFSYEEKTKMRGSVDLKLYGPDGELKETRYIPNLVVNVGKNYIATRMLGTTTQTATATTATLTSCMTHMAIGTGTTTVAVGDTSLAVEVSATGDITQYFRAPLTTTTQSANVITYVALFGTSNPNRSNSSNTTEITEAGIFNSSSSTGTLTGTMLCRTTFNVVNKGNDDTLQITWTITVS